MVFPPRDLLRADRPLAFGLAAVVAAPSAPAALLDEPPKLYTFKLDEPALQGAPRLPLP